MALAQLDPEVARIPMILCTTAVQTVKAPAPAANLDQLGVRVLLKPFDIEALVTTIAEVLAAQKLIDQAQRTFAPSRGGGVVASGAGDGTNSPWSTT